MAKTKEELAEISAENGRKSAKKTSRKQAGIPKDAKHKPPKSDGSPLHKGNAAKNQAVSNSVHRAIEATALDYLREALVKVNDKGVPFYKEYVDAFLQNALKDPEGVCSRMLGSSMFSERTLQKLDKESQDAVNKDREFAVYRIRKTLFDKQMEVFDDDYSKKAIIICSRRAGKTELNARKILKIILTRDTPVLYLNKTFDNAVRQLFDIVVDLAAKVELPISRASKSEGFIEFTNGSSIMFGGVSDIASIEKYRGFKFRLVIVDEIGHIKNAKYLIDEVLTPATMDFADSQMFFTGTPPRTKNFATKLWNSAIKHYHWTAADNPFIPNYEQFIEGVCAEKGLTKDDPYIQREYYGNMNAYDTEAIVWKNYKLYTELPADHIPTKVYIGVDFGYVDDNAIVTVSVDKIRRRAYVIGCDTFNKADDDQIMARCELAYAQAMAHLSKYDYDPDRIPMMIRFVTDTNQPSLAASMRKKLKCAVIPAYKYDMIGSCEQLAAELRTRLFVPEEGCDKLKDDFDSTVFKRDDEDRLIPEIDDDAYHPNAAHALRYAQRNWCEDWGGERKEPSNVEELNTTTYIEPSQIRQETLPPWIRAQQQEEYI